MLQREGPLLPYTPLPVSVRQMHWQSVDGTARHQSPAAHTRDPALPVVARRDGRGGRWEPSDDPADPDRGAAPILLLLLLPRCMRGSFNACPMLEAR